MKRQITDSICENLTDSDLESRQQIFFSVFFLRVIILRYFSCQKSVSGKRSFSMISRLVIISSAVSYVRKDTLLSKKNLPASRAHSHRALRAPKACDLIVALRAPFFLDLAFALGLVLFTYIQVYLL